MGGTTTAADATDGRFAGKRPKRDATGKEVAPRPVEAHR
jgi:hypothetical protein